MPVRPSGGSGSHPQQHTEVTIILHPPLSPQEQTHIIVRKLFSPVHSYGDIGREIGRHRDTIYQFLGKHKSLLIFLQRNNGDR